MVNSALDDLLADLCAWSVLQEPIIVVSIGVCNIIIKFLLMILDLLFKRTNCSLILSILGFFTWIASIGTLIAIINFS